uniref:Uncharacterized protein n=1 Tax=Setaria viridis TaxID=4556 RepID=A0A4U6T3A5_SETVI|nr:hypothetical protein SEVIR_9G293750v2 [Setaria viridis]
MLLSGQADTGDRPLGELRMLLDTCPWVGTVRWPWRLATHTRPMRMMLEAQRSWPWALLAELCACTDGHLVFSLPN